MSEFFRQPVQTLYGKRIVIMEDRPKMQLSADCPVTDDFRVEMNLWMRRFFGMVPAMPDGQTIVADHLDTIFMNPRTYQHVRKAML